MKLILLFCVCNFCRVFFLYPFIELLSATHHLFYSTKSRNVFQNLLIVLLWLNLQPVVMSLVHEEIPLCWIVALPQHVWNRSFYKNHPNKILYDTYPIAHLLPKNSDLTKKKKKIKLLREKKNDKIVEREEKQMKQCSFFILI